MYRKKNKKYIINIVSKEKIETFCINAKSKKESLIIIKYLLNRCSYLGYANRKYYLFSTRFKGDL